MPHIVIKKLIAAGLGGRGCSERLITDGSGNVDPPLDWLVFHPDYNLFDTDRRLLPLPR